MKRNSTNRLLLLATLVAGLGYFTAAQAEAAVPAAECVAESNLSTLELALKDSKWSGTYKVYENVHATALEISSVQSGYIGGVLTHTEKAPGTTGYLKVKVAGDIVPQYKVDSNSDGIYEWVDQDQIANNDLAALDVQGERQVIRLKRFRGLEYVKESSGRDWNQSREYRLTLENGILSGTVGIPTANYGEGLATTENGAILMTSTTKENRSLKPFFNAPLIAPDEEVFGGI